MYKQEFGTKGQVCFDNEQDYYEFLGYLSKNDNSTLIINENNDEQGAWGKEKRILFFVEQPEQLLVKLTHTAGVGNIISRINCNEFIENIIANNDFVFDGSQNIDAIRNTIPEEFITDFERGLNI